MKLILLRHGESQWNFENKFTGWKDVSLTDTGIKEANFSGQQLNDYQNFFLNESYSLSKMDPIYR